MAAYAKGNPARWWKGRSCGGASRAPGSLFISPFRRIEDPQTGQWNYARLRNNANRPPERPKDSGGQAASLLPVILIRDARVEWGEIHSGHVMGTGTTHIDGRLTPDPVVTSIYR